MTGYGEATVEAERFVLAIEIKTVNNRFLKIGSKISEEVFYLQNELEELVRRRLRRGSVFFSVRFEPTRFADLFEIDEEVLKKYLNAIQNLKSEFPSAEGVQLKDLLLLPGVIRTEEALVLGKGEVLPVARQAMKQALSSVEAMRREEGHNLEQDLRKRCHAVVGLVERIKQLAPSEVEQYRSRLERRVRLLLGEQTKHLAPEDILKEVAIFAERSDISEEVARMESHVKQFTEALENSSPVGRKLDFIAQEMFREANTMGSKSSGSELNECVVELKAEVDRIKEQTLNIE